MQPIDKSDRSIDAQGVNAAMNILQKGLSTVGHTEFQAWGDETSMDVGAILRLQVLSLTQESHRL